jgi:curved DNA-binding protein CbpA
LTPGQPPARENVMKDYYETLGVPPNASLEEIKRQFRYLVQAHHPDKFKSDVHKAQATEEIKKINEAYQVLSDPLRRAEYDRQRERASGRSAKPKPPKPEASNSQRPPVIITCPSCGQVNNATEIYCQRCAHQLSGSRLCPHCNRSVPVNAWYCTNCGRKLQILEQVM